MHYKKILLVICTIMIPGCTHIANKDKICGENERVLKSQFLYAVTHKPMVNRQITVKRSTGKVETYKTDKEGYIPTLCSKSKDETVQFIVQKPS